MATYNITVTSAWTKVAETNNDSVLVTWDSPTVLEVATTTADAAPTVAGHRLSNDQAITRAALGSGYVWVKTVPGTYSATVLAVVSK